jgi:hypothetical protein
LTLAQTGKLLREHEATVSRQLARTRRALRKDVERHLLNEAGLHEDEVARCFECALEDAGPLDPRGIIGGKESDAERSGT